MELWHDAVEAGVVEWRPGADDPAALALMDKLAAHSRKRWPADGEVPAGWSVPGLLPTAPGPVVSPSPREQQTVEPVER